MDIGEHWSVVGGLRFDHFGGRLRSSLWQRLAFHPQGQYRQPPRGPRLQAGRKFEPLFFLRHLLQSVGRDPDLGGINQGLGPERDHTYEVGGKINILDGQLGLTAAAFNTVKTNARISDPLNPGLQSLAGTERMNGVEFGAQGHITENWELTAGYTYLAPHAVGLIAVGVPGPIPNVARNQANIWSVYDFDSGLNIGGGLNWTGRREAGEDNLSVPGTHRHIQIAVLCHAGCDDVLSGHRQTHLADQRLQSRQYFYYATSYDTRPNENHTQPGAGRTFLLTAGFPSNAGPVSQRCFGAGDGAISAPPGRGPWSDGRVTAGSQSGAVKHNLQLPEDCAEAVSWATGAGGIGARAAFPQRRAAVAKVFPPLFNRYTAWHGIRRAYRQCRARRDRDAGAIRTDRLRHLIFQARRILTMAANW